jgi:hypothetical protein
MSKVISFSISDKYLEKLRTLYPDSTDNLAVKQFVTDRLDEGLSNSLDASLDDRLDGRVKTLVESCVDGLLDERLDATVGKLIGSLTERLARIETRLDDSLDGRLDDMEPLLRLQRAASIADHSPDEPAIVPPNEPNAIEPAIDTLPVPIQGTDEPVETDSSIETGTGAIETDSKPWYTIDDLLDCHYPSWPKTKEGLRKKALTEQWPKRTRRGSKGNPYEYQAVLPSQGKD